MLRRTKAERAADLRLPPLEIEVRELTLSPAEQDFYDCLYKKTKARFDAFVHKGTAMHNYAHIFELLARMRQCLDHPSPRPERASLRSAFREDGASRPSLFKRSTVRGFLQVPRRPRPRGRGGGRGRVGGAGLL